MPRVALVNMPFASPRWPNLAPGPAQGGLGPAGRRLRRRLSQSGFRRTDRPGGLSLAGRLVRLRPRRRAVVCQALLSARTDCPTTNGTIAKSLLKSDPAFGLEERAEYESLAPQAAAMLDRAIASRDWRQYDVVGFTSSFQQTMASLCLARRIKQLRPGREDHARRGGLRLGDGDRDASPLSPCGLRLSRRGRVCVSGGRAASARRRTCAAAAGSGRATEAAAIAASPKRMTAFAAARPTIRTSRRFLAHRRQSRRSAVSRFRRLFRPPPPQSFVRPDRSDLFLRGVARLLVGAETPLHVLRAQRQPHALPQQDARRVVEELRCLANRHRHPTRPARPTTSSTTVITPRCCRC